MDETLPNTNDGGSVPSPSAPVNEEFQEPGQFYGEEEEGDPEDVGHSLPSPEEIKADHPPSSGSDMRPMVILVSLLLFSIIIVGLSVGLTADNRRENKLSSSSGNANNPFDATNPPPNAKDRRQRMLDWVVEQGVSTDSDFQFAGTPQSRALDFMAFIDGQQFEVPSEDKSSPLGYKFLSRYVMSVLYYSLGGPRWNYNLLFLSEHDTCDWYFVFAPPVGQVGVLCNQSTMQVVGVSFIFNKLDGELPKEMGHLTTMTYIESIGNNIKGTIPDTFSQLTDLRTAVFPYNLLSGTVPAWVGQLAKLEFFYVSDNFMTGTLPTFTTKDKMSVFAVDDNVFEGPIDFAWEFSRLEHLFLEDNLFTGEFPTSITVTNPNLETLDVSGNKMTGKLPNDLFRLTKLEILDAHNNNLDGKLPSDVNLSSNLNFIALHKNRLTGVIPSNMANLVGLEHLDLSNNQLMGEIPNEMANLNKMTYMFLSQNNFTPGPIPTFFYTFNSLRELGLKSTSRTGPISQLAASLQNLVLLDLDDNKLTGAIPSTLADLPNLQFLLLNRNELSGDVPTELGRLTALQVCMLDRNNLTGTMNDICDASTLGLAVADCNEVTCDCCVPCCVDGSVCHDIELISNLDPEWEAGYERRFFNFGNNTDSFELIRSGSP